MKYSAGIILCFIFSCTFAQQAHVLKINRTNNSLLWEVTGHGIKKPTFLFGTFHLLCKDDIHFSESFIEALSTSDEVYMELKMDDPNMLINGLKYLRMKNNLSLKDVVSAAEYKKLSNYITDSLHMPMMMMQNVKPYFLVAMLYPQMLDCSSPSGVEEELLKIVKANKKPVKGLETMQFQSSIFDTIPYKLQAKELLITIDSLAASRKEFQQLVALYKKQELSKMNDIALKSEEVTKKYDDILLYQRNKKWVKYITPIIKKNKSLFIAVGAGHLSGRKGLIELLRKEGFVVRPLMN